ncbi:hypothetical protein J15TS10_10270 [Paenibacillus woosongensis]|uniref:Uncharacterized protein n=1 Tax=Paenibacillus woosongensis TaxID=307580 RepID=A0ABQ4MMJ9_9BACL|nr:hypothetical protein J15TS10_10270 [Paenibacillus woosongensis]
MIVICAVFPYNPIQTKMYECLLPNGKTVGPKAALVRKLSPRVNREAGAIPARSRHCKQG